MNTGSSVSLSRTTAALFAAVLMVAGAAVTYFAMRGAGAAANRAAEQRDHRDEGAARTSAGAPAAVEAQPAGYQPLADVHVPLADEAVQRAGIVVAPVSRGTMTEGIRLPGVIEPNAYRQVAVTPLVAGRVTRVTAELGDRVRRGQTLAQVYSPELAEAQTRYLSSRAQLEAHDRELQRTAKLVEIGAASRQELERIHAEHTAQTADVQAARSRLELLGMAPSAIDGLVPGKGVSAAANVTSPITGVVTERAANVGLNVDPSAKLFTVVDLSTVWVVADVYEQDFAQVRVGAEATVTTPAYADLTLVGRVSYIDPQVNASTRTAKVRVEVPNRRGELRLGMYADVMLKGARRTALVVPRTALQNVGDRQVVYLVDPRRPGTFIEREVRLGRVSGRDADVLSGLEPGDVVATEGSFFIRAERERLGLRATRQPAAGAGSAAGRADGAARVQAARVTVGEQGFEPARVTFKAGTPARITFVRTTDKTCATEVVFPSLNIRRALPLKEAAVVEFTPERTGEIAFACGMNMLRGVAVVQ